MMIHFVGGFCGSSASIQESVRIIRAKLAEGLAKGELRTDEGGLSVNIEWTITESREVVVFPSRDQHAKVAS